MLGATWTVFQKQCPDDDSRSKTTWECCLPVSKSTECKQLGLHHPVFLSRVLPFPSAIAFCIPHNISEVRTAIVDVNKIGGLLPGFSGFVKYRKHRVHYNPFSPFSEKQRLQTIFTKSREWRHEQEYLCD
jgi:hypothetical protein